MKKQDEEGPYDHLLGWFYGDNELFLEDNLPDNVYHDTLMNVPNLKKLIATYQADCPSEDLFFMMEFLLWGLEANKKLNKYRTMEGFQFKDGLGNLLAGI